MNIEQLGSFRTATADDGSLEVWARGWRLESQLYALIPMGLAVMFLLAPMGLVMRVGGALMMLGATLFAFRMTKPGLWFTPEAVSIVSVTRTQVFPWAEVQGFMGERRHDEARILLMLDDDRRVSLPGTLDPEELDPYGDEGQMLSAADQLNQLRERAVAGDLPKPAVPVVTAAAPDADAPAKERRRERKELRAALKAVRLPAEKRAEPAERATPAPEETPNDEARQRPRRLRRRAPSEPAPALTEVPIAGPEPAPARAPRRARTEEPAGIPSYFPTPTYIPQAEYAQMLRDQKAADKAAAAAAAELRHLAEAEEIDELAAKEEFSDWAS
ncbi:MAG TPA: hypothetical protein VFZ75_04995 [Actinomycetota bacterium]|nr:hypothetical protein [Actinomycetota bacterium]